MHVVPCFECCCYVGYRMLVARAKPPRHSLQLALLKPSCSTYLPSNSVSNSLSSLQPPLPLPLTSPHFFRPMATPSESSPLLPPSPPPHNTPTFFFFFSALLLTLSLLSLSLPSTHYHHHHRHSSHLVSPLSLTAHSRLRATRLRNTRNASFVLAVLGDWGRLGADNQRQTATAMATVLSSLSPPAQLIISAGDNFYDYGVTSVTDSQFIHTFESVYSAPILRSLPWYISLGNHDHRGSIPAQLQYSSVSPRWHLPARYYSLALNDQVTAILLDTTEFSNGVEGDTVRAKHFVNPKRQLDWLAATLKAAPRFTRFLVLGHHNMYSASVADHQGDVGVRDAVEPVLLPYAHRVLAYVSGHEHALMHMQPYGVAAFDHFVSGAGSRLRRIVQPAPERHKYWLHCCNVLAPTIDNHSTQTPKTIWASSQNGFMVLSMKRHTFYVDVYALDASLIHQYQRSFF